MKNITIRKSTNKGSNLCFVDIDGNTVWAEDNKPLLKKYITDLIDEL